MRHRVAHRKLGRTSEHRKALLRNQAEALLRHERIKTTVPKAKELRPFVERLITIAKRGLASGDVMRGVHARRLVRRDIADRVIVSKLFNGIAPRFEKRAGGYTRLLRLGLRLGDKAEMAQVELVGSEYSPDLAEPLQSEVTTPDKSRKGVGGRLRAAARRIRGKGDVDDSAEKS
ncbi:MAG TPA: 50S ribosomal protein L17 [Acidobacteria bacterium]|jgi:large subunit ribosomal protein L17|nr:50S ribosomal protein L17 [Acidobacteriota bacterium]